MSAGRTREEWAREVRARRAANRQRLTLHKSRRRDPRAYDYGRWWLRDEHNYLVYGGESGATLDEVYRYLNGEGP